MLGLLALQCGAQLLVVRSSSYSGINQNKSKNGEEAKKCDQMLDTRKVEHLWCVDVCVRSVEAEETQKSCTNEKKTQQKTNEAQAQAEQKPFVE